MEHNWTELRRNTRKKKKIKTKNKKNKGDQEKNKNKIEVIKKTKKSKDRFGSQRNTKDKKLCVSFVKTKSLGNDHLHLGSKSIKKKENKHNKNVGTSISN